VLVDTQFNSTDYINFYFDCPLVVGTPVQVEVESGFSKFKPLGHDKIVSIWMFDIFPDIQWQAVVKSCKLASFDQYHIVIESENLENS
jgi:hypothetical protein